jgi:hypothetical protein
MSVGEPSRRLGVPEATPAQRLQGAGRRRARPGGGEVQGLGIGPLKWVTEARKEVLPPTGSPVVPVLFTDEGEAIRESARIAEWAAAHPAGA